MTNILVKTGIAALIALAGFSASASTAAASGSEFRILVQHGWDDRGRDRHHDRWDRPRRDRGGRCAPWLAEEKARHMGLRRARVVDVDRRTVTVVGRDRRGRDRVVFANDRGCPLIRR
ncbi:hypothetical protein REJC140_00370 [Pseudorhizobium endolithicum]|uniref:Antifreeze protein n=1 Tax=Pseudorhizobium endolithicum TaxID=1191678 RepID=A0ABM8PDU8_9HYPH|nr:hypothetical protein [Pseudorhizobium endolithicum]CAD7023914.1 hypothetical protein REJC140_00370 [Pseudorhizobium endolithicum]